MTASRANPVIAAPDVESTLAALRRRGMRISAPRRLILEALFEAHEPMSAPELSELAELDPASVYANLQALEEVGLISHVHLGHGAGRYALADRVEREYLECERCGVATAVKPSVLAGARAVIREATGFTVRFDHFPVRGICRDCRSDRGAHD